MSDAVKAKIQKSIEDIPSLPLTALKIIRLANDVNAPPQEMLETIRVDPVITGKVLQLINSSYFGLSANVTDLRQALVMLGNNTIKNLALTSALLQTMKSKGSGHAELDLDGLWLRSLATAVGAKIIAKAAGLPRLQHDEFFLIGLLHDLGRIFIFQFLADEYVEVIEKAKNEDIPLEESERSILTMSSPEIGGLLAEKWQLPPNISAGIRNHRDPENAGDFEKICAIIKMAAYIVREKEIGWSEGLPLPGPPEKAIEIVGVSLEKLVDPMQVMSEEIDNAKNFIQE
ncbi:MAG: HDOD domain-containing protein [Lentisphaeraceae bacterium]|nr:HDOD domain-containing protein [Lentisphaeraceae bacterium]